MGTFLGGCYNKDYSTLAIFRSPYLGKLPNHYNDYVALYNPVSPHTVGFAGPRDSFVQSVYTAYIVAI